MKQPGKALLVSLFFLVINSLTASADHQRNTTGIHLSDDPALNELILSLYTWGPGHKSNLITMYGDCPKQFTRQQLGKIAYHLSRSRYTMSHGDLAKLAATGRCMDKDLNLAEKLLYIHISSDFAATYALRYSLQERMDSLWGILQKNFKETGLLDKKSIKNLLTRLRKVIKGGADAHLKHAKYVLNTQPVPAAEVVALEWAKAAAMLMDDKDSHVRALKFITDPEFRKLRLRYDIYADTIRGNYLHRVLLGFLFRDSFIYKKPVIAEYHYCYFKKYTSDDSDEESLMIAAIVLNDLGWTIDRSYYNYLILHRPEMVKKARSVDFSMYGMILYNDIPLPFEDCDLNDL